MSLPNIFTKEVSEHVIHRINQLKPDTQPNWGIMNAGQMLAHCNVAYDLVYSDKQPKPNFLMKFILKSFIKENIVNEKPYKHNSRTAPAFLIKDNRNFDEERNRLIDYIISTRQLGENHFYKKESISFGPLSTTEWNNMFYKHLDHHLTQFGV